MPKIVCPDFPKWSDTVVDFSQQAVLNKLTKLAVDKSPGPGICFCTFVTMR